MAASRNEQVGLQLRPCGIGDPKGRERTKVVLPDPLGNEQGGTDLLEML
jgi:hypothetical protein